MADEWQELAEDFKLLEKSNRVYLDKLGELDRYQKECEKQIQHQSYRIGIIKKSLKNKPRNDLQEEIARREAHLDEIRKTLPQPSGTYLKIILGNVNVSILNKDDKLKYKSEYEMFKLILSAVAFVMAMLNLAVVSRRLERLYLFMLVWYYCTLTIRESILRVNGSRIKGWWRLHHFISDAAAAILLIWPEGDTWDQFRDEFMMFNAYLSFVQYLQFRYQQGVLYRLKALGERYNMDITVEGFHSWMWKGLSFLFPFLFVVYFVQLHFSLKLYFLSCLPSATWHVRVLSVMFFVLGVGNITTALMIIPDKFRRNLRLQYGVLSQSVRSKWNNNGETDKRK